jgi:hypothetical protein
MVGGERGSMPKGHGIYDDDADRDDANNGDTDEPKGGRPGPTDQGREGGMATRENAPELTSPEGTQEPPD